MFKTLFGDPDSAMGMGAGEVGADDGVDDGAGVLRDEASMKKLAFGIELEGVGAAS